MKLHPFLERCGNEVPAFVEMWLLIKQFPSSTPETNPILRYRAKLQMEKAPTLTKVSLVVPAVLFVLFIVLAMATGVGLFAAFDVVLALVLVALVIFYQVIRIAKPVEVPAGASAKSAEQSVADLAAGKSEEEACTRATASAAELPKANEIAPAVSAGEDVGAAKTPNDDDNAPAERPSAKLDTYGKRLAVWAAVIIVLVVYYSMNDNPGMWMGWIFFVIVSLMLRLVAHDLVNIYVLAFVDPQQTIPVGRVKVLKKIAYAVVCVPFLFTAYGAIKGGYEVFTSEKSGDQVIINMLRYKMTCADMNWLTRLGYRWAYHSLLDFKEVSGAFNGFSGNSSGGYATAMGSDVTDMDCSMEISTALMQDNIELARQWAQRIKDDRLKRYQLEVIRNQEKIRNGLQQMQTSSEW